MRAKISKEKSGSQPGVDLCPAPYLQGRGRGGWGVGGAANEASAPPKVLTWILNMGTGARSCPGGAGVFGRQRAMPLTCFWSPTSDAWFLGTGARSCPQAGSRSWFFVEFLRDLVQQPLANIPFFDFRRVGFVV